LQRANLFRSTFGSSRNRDDEARRQFPNRQGPWGVDARACHFIPNSLTFAESGLPGFEASAWFGLYAPRGTSREIVNKINAETQRIIATPAFHEKVLALYFGEAITSSADEFANFIKSEHQKWGNVIRGAKIDKLD